MDQRKTGIWLIGAFGGVGTSLALGLAALQRKLIPSFGLATELPLFQHLPFRAFESLVVGGHDVRRVFFEESARQMSKDSRNFDPILLDECRSELDAWSDNVRPGIVRQSGKPIEEFADWQIGAANEPLETAVQRLANDIREFAKKNDLAHVVVLNVSSTEPVPKVGKEHASWKDLQSFLAKATVDSPLSLPASSLYALAACEANASYLNFTPSLGLSTPAMEERAIEAKILYAGKDGKTGETLLKSVLAPMFAHRNLQVLSWVGHNILGNRDGLVLNDPANKRGKIEAKGELVGQMLGYEPQSLVSIEHIGSLGDWKTAWDHIHFAGFLGTKMTMQFIWQGSDSLLAAPLALDLIRWTDLAHQRGETGCMKHVASYFKSPMHTNEHDFYVQWQQLLEYAKTAQ